MMKVCLPQALQFRAWKFGNREGVVRHSLAVIIAISVGLLALWRLGKSASCSP